MLYHVSRSILQEISPSVRQTASFRLKIPTTSPTSLVCIQCRLRTTTTQERRAGSKAQNISVLPRQARQLASFAKLQKEEKPELISNTPPTVATSKTPQLVVEEAGDEHPSKSPLDGSSVHIVPDEDLPSHREKLKWRLSRRFNKMMDDLMPRLALASQRINTFTGTDYSAIQALRNEIIEQGTASTQHKINRGLSNVAQRSLSKLE
jgi:sensitive to high expression protein 9